MSWINLTLNQWIGLPIEDWAVLPLDYDSIPDIIYRDLYIKSNYENGVYTNIGIRDNLNKWYDLSSDQFKNFTISDWLIFYAQSGLIFSQIYDTNLYIQTSKLINYER